MVLHVTAHILKRQMNLFKEPMYTTCKCMPLIWNWICVTTDSVQFYLQFVRVAHDNLDRFKNKYYS